MQQSNLIDKDKKLAKKLQMWIKAKKLQKIFQKMKKKYRYRKNVIYELIQTERGYNKDLRIICDQVKNPLIQQNILTLDQIKDVFMNIEEISQFNQQYLAQMEIGFKNFDNYTPYQIVFHQNTKQLENINEKGFKCYYEYCGHFTKSGKLLEQLQQQNPQLQEFLKGLNRQNTLKGMDLASFLVKPIQRLPKYILLYKDLLKHTDEDHPDFKNIKFQFKYFGEVNEENNKNMDIFMNRLMIKELCQHIGLDPQILLEDETRVSRFEDKIKLVQKLNNKEEEDQFVTVHAMSDCLLLVHDEKYLKIVKLDSLSFVKDQTESNKYFSFLYQIVGNGDTIQCQSDSAQNKKKIIEQFEKLIHQLREQEFIKEQQSGKNAILRFPAQVTVIGTQIRNFQSFSKHTVYITQIQLSKLIQNIYVRYSDVQEMCARYQKKYPDIKFPVFPSYGWLKNQKTKTIEARKIAIENFLQNALQAKELIQDGQILSDLRLPGDFFDLPRVQQQKKKSQQIQYQNIGKTTVDGMMELQQKGIKIDRLKKSAGELLNAVSVEQSAVKEKVTEYCPNTIKKWEDHFGNDPNIFKLDITMPDGNITTIGVDAKTRADEVLQFVGYFNRLEYLRDFRLYLVDQLQKSRLLDEDEVVYKVYLDEKNSHSGVLSQIEKFLTQSNDQVVLRVRKYIYLPAELEEFDYQMDPVRLQYLAYSIFEDVYEQKFTLGFNDYCLYAACYYTLKYPEKIEISITNLQLDKIKKIVPIEFYKTIPEKQWEEMTLKIISTLHQRLKEISKKNKEKILSRQITDFTTDISQLAAGATMNAAKQNPLHSMAIFQVQTYEQSLQFLKSVGMQIFPTIYLGISINKLHLLNPQRKESFRTIDYIYIKSIKSYPNQIVFDFDNFKEPIRFDTYQSYEIKLLIEKYQQIQRFDDEYQLGHKFNAQN